MSTSLKIDDEKSVVYGVRSEDSKSIIIELTLNIDHTFNYIDNTKETKKTEVKGRWKKEGNVITLEDYNSTYPINDKWKIDSGYPCIKSRKGLEFTRICNCESNAADYSDKS